MSKVKWPFGAADSQSKDYAAVVAATIENTRTHLTIAQATGAATLNLTLSPEQAVGDELFVQTSADGTNRVITWGTGMLGVAVTNTASKSFMHSFVFNGTAFVHQGSVVLN
jgi:hypothetical protein